jgi:hypothetical protein
LKKDFLKVMLVHLFLLKTIPYSQELFEQCCRFYSKQSNSDPVIFSRSQKVAGEGTIGIFNALPA